MDRSTHPIQRLSPEEADLEAVLALARAAEDDDGDPPLSDQTLVDLRTEPERADLAEASADGRALAAAVLVRSRAQGAPALLEGVVDSQERGRGLGRRLIETILEGHHGPVDAWSHGDHPAARHLAQTLGFEPVRARSGFRRSSCQTAWSSARSSPAGTSRSCCGSTPRPSPITPSRAR